MASSTRPEVLLLSLDHRDFFDEQYKALIDQLAASATVSRVKTADAAIRHLAQNTPHAIIVTDEGLIKRDNREVLEKLRSYVQNGGIAVVGHRTDFQLQQSCMLPRGVSHSSFPPPYSMKVLHVQNARPRERIFVPVSGATTQSHVFSAEPVDASQAAVTGAKIGDGYLAYCGDVNAEAGSDLVILSLCGLRG